MADHDFDDFEDFWAHYLAEHSDPTNRLLHAIGTSSALATAAVGLLKKKPKLLALAPLIGYGSAWLGHLAFEGNLPATFGNPVWSLRSDFRMLRLMLSGELEEETMRLIAEGKDVRLLLQELEKASA